MKLKASQKYNRKTCILDFLPIKHELVKQLAEYIIENDLCEIIIEKGKMTVSIDVDSGNKQQ